METPDDIDEVTILCGETKVMIKQIIAAGLTALASQHGAVTAALLSYAYGVGCAIDLASETYRFYAGWNRIVVRRFYRTLQVILAVAADLSSYKMIAAAFDGQYPGKQTVFG